MRHNLKIFLVLGAMIVLCLALDLKAKADTTLVSGTIHSNTTWTPDGNPYIVIGGTRVDTSVILTIQAGVLVKFNDGLNLIIDGALDARGTPSDSITFTNNQNGWGCIAFRNSSMDTLCFLEYCILEHGGSVVYCENASPTVRHCSIRSCYSHLGGCIRVEGGSPIISSNTIIGSTVSGYDESKGGGIYINGSPIISNNIISGNRAVFCPPEAGWGGGIYIANGAPIISNNVIESNWAFVAGGGVYVAGGTPIIACNTISGNSAGQMPYPASYGSGGGIYVASFTRLYGNTITGNFTIYYGNGAGILVASSASLYGNTITGNFFQYGEGVRAGGIWIAGNVLDMNYNNIYSNADLINSIFEVFAGSGPTPINGENNWWGTTDPNMIDLLIYDFWDDPSLREINYTPFSTSLNSPPSDSIVVISPNGGEELWSDQTYTIQWNPFCFTDNVKIEYSTNSGYTWESVIGSTRNFGFYSWQAPLVSSTNCRVKVSDAVDGIPSDVSDSDFTICPGPTIIVTYPSGGETLIVDSTYHISWNTLCFDSNVKIEYSTNSGNNWIVIVPDTGNIGSIAWTVSNTPSPHCRVKISDASDGDPFDVSDSDFIIYKHGDVNSNGTIDLGDVVYLITYLYKGGPAPNPLIAGDVNCNGIVDLGDVVYLITYLYKGGPPPPC